MKYNNRNLQTLIAKRAKDKETGVSLVEILVYIALFAVVAVMTVTIITTTMNSSSRFSDTSTTQTQVNQAASIIQRDIALATAIEKATPSSITFLTRQDARDFRVSIFAYTPGTPPTEPNVNQSQLPNYPAIIEVRTDLSTPAKKAQSVLVKGYTNEVQVKGYKELFTYYNTVNSLLPLTTTSSKSEIDKIARVAFHIAAKADGRTGFVQIESSVTPAFKLSPNVSVNNLIKTIPDCPANFSANITARETQANVTWAAPAGATSYTVYRYDEDENGQLELSKIIPNPDTTSWVDTGLQWGHDYRYAIQSAGPSGVSTNCITRTATVVPQQTGFSNINPFQQSLTAVKATSAAESLTWNPPVGTAQNAATQNAQAGNRYTVARNTTNQLAWTAPFGATQYKIYVNGSTTAAATVSSGTIYWQDVSKSFGAVTSYQVSSINAGGESFLSAPISLTSPPAASTFTYARPDTSTRSTTTDNDISVVNRAPNTDGYKTQRTMTIQASGDCNATAPLTDSYFAGNSVRDSNVEWGSWSCYRFIPFNAAGDGQVSANMTIKQFPVKFVATSVTSSQHRNIDVNRALPGGAQCWVSNTGTTRTTCNAYAGMNSDNRFAVGLFGSISNSKTDINVVWARSYNAYGDYQISKNRIASGGTQDQGSPTSTNNAGYVTGAQSSLFKNEMPGSAFDFVVTAKALNGETRNSTNTIRALTTPDIPASLDNNFQTRNPVPYMRIKVYADGSVRRGMASQIGIVATNDSGRIEDRYNADGGVKTTYSYGFNSGWHSEYAYSYLNWGGMELYSQSTGSDGATTPGCVGPCGGDFGEIPEMYPRYYAGAHYRYNSGGYASPSVDGGPGNNDPAPNPTGPIAPPATGAADGGMGYNCATISENDVNFNKEYGCNYGTGIPPQPTNLTYTRSNQTVTLNWSAVANATGYSVVYVTEGVSATKNVTANTTTLDLPWGTTTLITVRAKNNVTESPDSNQVTVALPQAPVNAVTDLRLANLTGTSVSLGWTAEPGADSYDVVITIDGIANTYNVTTTNYVYALSYGSNSSAVVYVKKGSSKSPASNTVSVSNPVPAPAAAPASLTSDNSGGTTSVTPSTLKWSAVTCAAGTTAQYQLTRTAPTNAIVYAFGPLTSSVQTHAANTAYSYSVVARCANGTKYGATTAAATTTFTARYNAPSAPGAAPAPNSANPYLVNSAMSFSASSNTCAALTGTTPTYFLYRNGTQVASSATTTLSTTAPATAGTYSYTYKIACSSGGYTTPESAASPAVSVSVVSAPATPSGFTLNTIFSNTATVSWSAVAGVDSYTITLGGSTTRTITGVTGTSYKITGLPIGGTITANIAAVDYGFKGTASSNISIVMPSSETTSKTFSKAPTNGGTSVTAGSALTSTDGHYSAVQQPDGNFVVYDNFTSPPTFKGHTNRWGADLYVKMQPDGNLVLYNGSNVGQRNTNTWMYSGAVLRMQTDGNLVLYSTDGVARWALSTGNNGFMDW